MTELNPKKKQAKTIVEHENARAAFKQKMWDQRIALIKKGNLMMKSKVFAEAVILYEKYLRILELIYDCGRDGLTPEMFKAAGRTSELTVIASVYWDLVRIYDSNPTYAARQKKAADKLAQFAVVTPLFEDFMKKARVFQAQSKHPDVIKSLIAKAGKSKARCFVATSAFDSAFAPEVIALRLFRDTALQSSSAGRKFIYFYYKLSPPFARFLDRHAGLKSPVRGVLRLFVKLL